MSVLLKQREPKLILPKGFQRTPPSMEVPFIETLPDGTVRTTTINRGAKIYAIASQFIVRGGRYLCARQPDGTVVMFAVRRPAPDADPVAYAGEVVNDGPGLPEAVDRLVKASLLALATATPQ